MASLVGDGLGRHIPLILTFPTREKRNDLKCVRWGQARLVTPSGGWHAARQLRESLQKIAATG